MSCEDIYGGQTIGARATGHQMKLTLYMSSYNQS